MRATGFTKFFQVIQVSSNRRLADPKRFAEVRNRDEPGTSDQFQSLSRLDSEVMPLLTNPPPTGKGIPGITQHKTKFRIRD